MKYSKTGKFTDEQMKAINELAFCLYRLNVLDCNITVNTVGQVKVYKTDDITNSSESLYCTDTDTEHPLKGIYVGNIDRQFSETPCFKKGYITEE